MVWYRVRLKSVRQRIIMFQGTFGKVRLCGGVVCKGVEWKGVKARGGWPGVALAAGGEWLKYGVKVAWRVA